MNLNKYIYKLKLLILLLLLSTATYSDVILKNTQNNYDDFEIYSYYDESSALDINKISEISFKHITSNRFTFGYLNGTRWFKLDITNKSDNESFVVNFNEALWETFNMYYSENGKWKKESNGLKVPLKDRDINDVNPSFSVNINKGQNITLYFQGQTKASQIGYFKIFTAKEYFNPLRLKTTHIYIIFSIILFTISILNIYKYILTREKVYMYYISYILTFLIFTSMQSSTYIILGFNGWSEGLHVTGTFVNIALIAFTSKLIEIRKQLPKMYYFFKKSILVFLIFAILIFYNIPYSGLLFNLYSTLFYTMLFITAYKIYKQGSLDAKNYLLALMIFAPLMALMILNFNALLDYSYFSRHIYLLGSIIEIIFFTLILTYKYRELNIQKIKVQNELIKEKQSQQELLEVKILERTKDLVEAQKELKKMAITDSLTKLYNRYKIDEVLNAEYKRAKRYTIEFGVILIDIDDFKLINDRFGHQVGDDTLIAIANCIKENVREVDIVGRWGGEEFIIICLNTNLEGIKHLAETIRRRIEQLALKPLDSQSASIGICQFRQDDNIQSLIKRADDALYKAKRAGKNCISTC